MRCSDFSSKIERRFDNPPFGSYYQGGVWEEIRPEMMAYHLAYYFCFLTGIEGYRREGSQKKIGFGCYLFKEPNSSKLEIKYVINDSPAGKLGFIKGDVIISINGRSASRMGHEEALQLIGREEGKKVSMVIQRMNETGQSKDLNLSFTTGKFLTDEPDWVKKIIKTVKSKPVIEERTGRANCDSPIWKNRPECMDY